MPEGKAEDDDRNRAERDVPAGDAVGRAPDVLVPQANHPRSGDAANISLKVDEDRRHGAKLDDGAERRARVLPAKQGGDHTHVTCARDWEELRQPLDDAEHDRFNPMHATTMPNTLPAS